MTPQSFPFSTEGVVAAANAVEGFFTNDDIRAISTAARHYSRPVKWVEIGAWAGRSMTATVLSLPTGSRFDTIDPMGLPLSADDYPDRLWGGYATREWPVRELEDSLANVRRLRPDVTVTHHRMLSRDALPAFPDESLDFVFVDGDHRTAAVLADCTEWLKKLVPWGIMLGHDYKVAPEVQPVVDAMFGDKLAVLYPADIWLFEKGSASIGH